MVLWYLAAASIPIAVLGFIFKEQAEEWRNPFLIGGMLIGIGLLMWLAERAGSGKKDMAGITLPDSLAIGVAQALAIVPGTSRSGVTIAAGAFRNTHPPSAAPISFPPLTPPTPPAPPRRPLHLM